MMLENDEELKLLGDNRFVLGSSRHEYDVIEKHSLSFDDKDPGDRYRGTVEIEVEALCVLYTYNSYFIP